MWKRSKSDVQNVKDPSWCDSVFVDISTFFQEYQTFISLHYSAYIYNIIYNNFIHCIFIGRFFITKTNIYHMNINSAQVCADSAIIGHSLISSWRAIWYPNNIQLWKMFSLIARFKGPTWGPSGADRTQVGPMLDPWTLLSGLACTSVYLEECKMEHGKNVKAQQN